MKLKEIKPGMVIHWKTGDEKAALLEELERLGYEWFGTHRRKATYACGDEDLGHVIHVYNDNGWKNITNSNRVDVVTHEFSDLIIPEMSAEEAFSIYKDICKHYFSCEECPLSNPAYTNCGMFIRDNSEKAIDIMGKWKSDHEKKEPEIEWVYRVFGAENNGEKFFQTEEEAIKRCEELAKSQKSKQYARYERVCRVKAVK